MNSKQKRECVCAFPFRLYVPSVLFVVGAAGFEPATYDL